MAAASAPTSGFRTVLVSEEDLQDIVSGEFMTRAFTLYPCGHVLNEDTIDRLGRKKICPYDRAPFTDHIINYNIRSLAEFAQNHPQERFQPIEEELNEEATGYFTQAKALSDEGNYELATQFFLKVLQINRHNQKARVHLHDCLDRASAAVPISPSESEEAEFLLDTSKAHRRTHLDKWRDAIDSEPALDSRIRKVLVNSFQKTIDLEARELTAEAKAKCERIYPLNKRLLNSDGEVSTFITEQLRFKRPRGEAATSLPVSASSRGLRTSVASVLPPESRP